MSAEVIRNRSVTGVLIAWFVFAALREYFGTYGISAYDVLISIPAYLFVTVPLLCAVVILEKLPAHGRSFASTIACDIEFDAHPARKSRRALFAGLAFIAWILILLERHQLYFFTQDDNLSQFLPVMLQGLRSMTHGIFPTWNPYQFLGAPTTSLGVYALTYPPLYVSYLISRYLLGNEFLTIEVFCILHLVGGYLAMYWAVRCYQVRSKVAAAAALCCALSGWALIASRSWYYVSPVFVYVPLMIVCVAKLLRPRSNGWRWIAGTALVIGLFFHAGNVQFWVYGLMFLWTAILILLWTRDVTWTDALRALAATLIGIAIASPVLVAQFLQTRNVERIMSPYRGEFSGAWLALIIPGPWIHEYSGSDWIDPLWRSGSLIFYSGTTFVVLAALLLACMLFYHYPRLVIGRNVWVFCAAIALLAAMGQMGILWPIMLNIPLLSKFRFPLKFLAFFDIFAVLSGSLVCERVLRKFWHRKWMDIVLTLVTVSFVAASCMYFLPSWYSYGIKPYPNGHGVVQHLSDVSEARYRVLSVAHIRSRSSDYWESMPLNLASVYQLPSLFGYDPLVGLDPAFEDFDREFERDPLDQLQRYGVAYALVSNDIFCPHFSGYRNSWNLERDISLSKNALKRVMELPAVFHDDSITVYQLSKPSPLAFSNQAPLTPLPLKLRSDGLDVDAASVGEGGKITLNFLWSANMRAAADGKRVLVSSDGFNRIVLVIPQGAKHITVRFSPPWGIGFIAGGILLLCGFLIGQLAIRQQNKIEAATSVSA